jgi:hypothetical protein
MSYTCPFCGITSHHPRDKAERYCGRCKLFADGPVTPERLRLAAGLAYHNPDFPLRACDACGRPYRGPAIYCSISCAERAA